MKLQNVRDFQREDIGYRQYNYSATVDVVTRPFPWIVKRVVSRGVALDAKGLYWYFTSDGQYTPNYQMERLARSEMHKRGWNK